jgi:formiminotetrahydrofolate cyclodeaminase
MYADLTVNQFLDALASKEPVPGGGSGAALAGALAAALVSMVCNLTVGKKGYEAVERDMEGLLVESEAIRKELPQLLEADTQAYARVMEAYRMPRASEEEKQAREAAMQERLKEAAEVPLRIAERCARVVALALLQSALLNVEINLASIKDAAYVEGMRQRMVSLVEEAVRTKAEVMEAVHGTINA